MESRLSRVSRLRTRSGIIGVQIGHPGRYYRQYLGIIIKNRKFIHINGLCEDKPPDSWRETLDDVCDGGVTGALFMTLRSANSHTLK
jgi:hypothetical protein